VQAAAIWLHCVADDPEKVASEAQHPLLTNVVQAEQSAPELPPPPVVPPVPCPPAPPVALELPPVPVVPPVPLLLPPVPVVPPVLPEVPPVLPPEVQLGALEMQASNAVQSVIARQDWAADATAAAFGQFVVFACWAHSVEQVADERPSAAA
jgi:hypothetical protein